MGGVKAQNSHPKNMDITNSIFDKIDPQLVAKASEWSEHKAPDGRSYFYNGKSQESVWEKPQDMKDLESKFAFSYKFVAF